MADPSAAQLLVQALESLTPAERQRVTAWLLDREAAAADTGPDTAAAAGPARKAERERLIDSLRAKDPQLRRIYAARSFADPALREVLGQQLATAGSLHGEHQLVPVRLPAELHTRLRDWCTTHGFSMATVIRGLTARFLDSQPESGAKAE